MVSALWKQNLPSFLQNKQMQACPNKMGFLWAGFAENAGVTRLLGWNPGARETAGRLHS